MALRLSGLQTGDHAVAVQLEAAEVRVGLISAAPSGNPAPDGGAALSGLRPTDGQKKGAPKSAKQSQVRVITS